MKNLSIKFKLILLFILIKIIPLLLISYIAYEGALKLENYIQNSTRYLFNQNKEIVINTANKSINDSIKNLNKKSQQSLEMLSFIVANDIAKFLYERDSDLLFLSKLKPSQSTYEAFYKSKNRDIIIHGKYIYNDEKSSWESTYIPKAAKKERKSANLKDNQKEFRYKNPKEFKTKSIPIYKEISFFNLKGKELYKVSQIDTKLLDISKKRNTYINSENYFEKIADLEKGQIYVSSVVGEYVKSKIIGPFTKQRAKKAGIEFKPEDYAYAGKENPVGKRFEGIIRFITPIYKKGKKVGYISLALDHEHLMQFTDTLYPLKEYTKQDIADASEGNYAFMWDYKGRNISHPRDYFISGFDKKTGKRVMPWLSSDVAQLYEASGKEINEFLKDYPIFESQSLQKKPNIKQLKEDGNIALDCRYLNFAPQCEGWMQMTQNGGFGSFVIYWSKVWKLTTAATIPYYTGQYKNSKRGFGFVTLGANVDEFHAAANETKRNVNKILDEQTTSMKEMVKGNSNSVKVYIKKLINELSIVTFIMVILIIAIAIWMSNYISKKIENLLLATKKFANKEFDYQIEVTSKDEIGNLENSFNKMALQIKNLIDEQKSLNEHLEEKVEEKTQELQEINRTLENQIEQRTAYLKETLKRAQKADEAKSIFLANMSHEIRTPLNAIIGFSEVLTKNSELSGSILKQTKIIHTSANALLSIINEILDISKIESGTFEINIENTDINYISEQVVELFSEKAHEKQLKMVFNIDPKIPLCVKSDGSRLKQVLSNILSNAIKFTQEKGSINFNILVLDRSESSCSIRFEIADNGIGIPKENMQTIFDPFIQVEHKSNRKFEGTGLGLSICKYIIESLDSKINVQSEVGKGTKFWFDLSFESCENFTFEDKNYIQKINFVIENSNSRLVEYILQYLNIFGNINSNSSENQVLIYGFKDLEELDDIRAKYRNLPKLILLEYEEEKRDIKQRKYEQFITLPFYASKINDALQELLLKRELKDDTLLLDSAYEGKILVAEDNSANQELISHILSSLHTEFEIANNGKEAYEAYKNSSFDLVLMDINMPIMDGVDSFKAIREYEKYANIKEVPVVAVTANAIKGDRAKFLNIGMSDYISKPISQEQLIKILNKFLKKIIVEVEKDGKSSLVKDKLPIDTKKIIDKIGVSPTVANIIVEKFKKEIMEEVEGLKNAIKTGNSNEVVQSAHYIKNSCLNVCLDELCEVLQKLENKDIDEIERKILFDNFLELLDRYL